MRKMRGKATLALECDQILDLLCSVNSIFVTHISSIQTIKISLTRCFCASIPIYINL